MELIIMGGIVVVGVIAVIIGVRTAVKGGDPKTLEAIKMMGEMISQNQKNTDEYQSKKFQEIDKNITDKQSAMNNAVVNSLAQMESRFKTFEQGNEQKLEAMREVMMKSLLAMQEDNSKKLEDMRKTVDEKLQKSLEENMTRSFKMVSERLEQVYKGLGEMQNLATGVGDLKKVLSNVKTRGILGEIQLGAILKEILSPEQYEENVVTVKDSRNPVEFAVKMPNGDGFVYLPIDSKFPGDAFFDLQTAYESGEPEAVKAALAVLMTRIKTFAKDIHDKYIEPPYTTDFAIMFLPFEGLYAEVVNNGMVEVLQSTYKVNIAGPSTMAALLNALQMGFKTLAIQKRSVEVWSVLSSVKSEFDKFGQVLEATQNRLDQANKELDKLVGVRTRAIQRKLKSVEALDGDAQDDEEE
ncbi:MAG: DNA recombination protein RmuC [Clostridiales bacterium]|nr:DNA recombination protein RmuC [Clostridiales bacterium]